VTHHRQALFAGALAVAVAALVVWIYWTPADSRRMADFGADYISARAWVRGDNPYDPLPELAERHLDVSLRTNMSAEWRNPHMPVQILATAPTAELPFSTAKNMWLLLSALCTGVGLYLVGRELDWSAAAALVAGAAGLIAPTVQADLLHVQVNGILMLLVVLAWRELRRGRDLRAGVLLGAATAIKLFPAFLLIVLLRQKRVRAALSQIVSAVALIGIGVVAVGGASALEFATIAAPDNFERFRAYPGNLSLASLPFRLFDIGPPAATLVALAVCGLCALLALRTPARFSGDPFWAAVPWMVLASPIAWGHYMVMALPVLLIGLSRRRQLDCPPWVWAGAMLVVLGGWGIELLAGTSVPTEHLWLAEMTGLLTLAAAEWRCRQTVDITLRPATLSLVSGHVTKGGKPWTSMIWFGSTRAMRTHSICRRLERDSRSDPGRRRAPVPPAQVRDWTGQGS
jgi:hypothetical protein